MTNKTEVNLSLNGWVCPRGEYHKTPKYMHADFAKNMLIELKISVKSSKCRGEQDQIYIDTLLSLGWCKCLDIDLDIKGLTDLAYEILTYKQQMFINTARALFLREG